MEVRSKLPRYCCTLFDAKESLGLSFEEIGKKMDRNEVWVAAVFYGQAKPTEEDMKKLASVLRLAEARLVEESMLSWFPDRGGLMSVPPTDPTLYRLYEILQVYGYPLKSVIHEKFGDGIMSAIDFETKVEKVENPGGGERVRITLDGKFLPYKTF
ncbi:Cyanase [Basidiobolus meristosporus CBS 931.73]|uniref:Cyanate hydratase n=1 Tax=Basidiobolus meristosporus CBS 931.73 TaxID=1314790 RepID=A0A1Y1YZ25_9FUNG|nr:Cyanase [Basidiobolus meristosporus CBS 931.73]|eukprot:ORY03271.1 Cyanase [Basidiobolus meristosporus CBS 931.73]